MGDGGGDGQLDRLLPLQGRRQGDGPPARLDACQPVPAALVAEVPEGSGLRIVLRQRRLGAFAEGHAPAGKELRQIPVRHGGGRTGHPVLIARLAAEVSPGLPGLEEAVVEIHGGRPVVIGQVELPVEAQLDEDVVGVSGEALGGLIENLRVFAALLQTGGQGVLLPVAGLDHQGIEVVGDFGLAQLVHVVSDFMGDAPAEKPVRRVRGPHGGDGLSANHACAGAVADADMAPRRVHEGPCEHLHAPDVLAGLHVVLGVGLVDALGGFADVHDVLPGQDSLVQGLNPLRPAPARTALHRRCGQGQQHGGGGNLRDVAEVRLHVAGQPGGIGLQLVRVAAQDVPPLAFAQGMPVRQLQHRDIRSPADVEADALGIRPAVGQVQASASGGVLAADLRNRQHVPPVGQRSDLGPPCGGLGVELAGVDRQLLPRRNAGGVDGQLLLRPGGHAQGLEVTAALPVLRVRSAAAGLDAAEHHAGGGSAPQQFLRQGQLVCQGVQIHVVIPLIALQPLPQGADIRLGDAGAQGGPQLIGKEGCNVVRQAAGRIILHKHQLRQAHCRVGHLLDGDADLHHVCHRLEGQHGKLRHGGVVPHGQPGVVVGGLASLEGIRGHQGAGAVQIVSLPPDGDGVEPEIVGIAPIQTGDPDDAAEVHGPAEGGQDLLVVPPVAVPIGMGGPVGAEIAVRHELRLEGPAGGIGGGGHVPGIRQPDPLDVRPLQDSLSGDALRPGVIHGGGGSQGGAGGSADPHAVPRLDVDGVGDSVGQVRKDGAGIAEAAAPLAVAGLALCLVVNFIERGVFRRLPSHGQGAVQGAHTHHVRSAGGPSGLRRGGHGVAGGSLPAAVHGSDGEQVGFQILQPRDLRPGHVHPQRAAAAAAAPEPVVHPVAGDVGNLAPAEADLLASGGGGKVPHHAAGGGGTLRDDLPEELDGFHGGVVPALGAGDGNHDFLHRHPATQGNGDYAAALHGADGANPLRQGEVKGKALHASVLTGHSHRARLHGLGAIRGDNLDFLHLHRLLQSHGELQGQAGEGDGPAAAAEQVLQNAGDQSGLRPQANLLHRRGQQVRIPDLRSALRVQVPADDGQVIDIHHAVAVQIILLQVPPPVGAQGLRQLLPVPVVNPAVAVHVSQGEGGVRRAQGDMLGVPVHGQLLAAVRIAVPGELQGVIPLGQAGNGQVQVGGPTAAAQGSAVLIPQGHGGGVAPQLRPAVLLRQVQGSQGAALLKQLRPNPPVPESLQRLGPVHSDRGGDAAGVRAVPGGLRRRKRGEQQRPGQQQG